MIDRADLSRLPPCSTTTEAGTLSFRGKPLMEQPSPAQPQYQSVQAGLPARQPYSQQSAGAISSGASPVPAGSSEDEISDEISYDEHAGPPFEDHEAVTHADARATSYGVGQHPQHAQPFSQANRHNDASSGSAGVGAEGMLSVFRSHQTWAPPLRFSFGPCTLTSAHSPRALY